MCVHTRVYTYLFEEHIHVMCEWVPMFYLPVHVQGTFHN
jgi:hypothetical protein